MKNLEHTPLVYILCGSGGVGKTTLSAALALSYTLLGKKALVITIDPAKRLATALGLDQLPKEPTNLSHQIPTHHKNIGEFYAVMPDASDTFRSFVTTISNGDTLKTQAILQTAIYQSFAQEFSGAHEYMAMETLWQMIQHYEFDVVVLDTPPSQNSKDLFTAPQTLSQFFDDGLMNWLGNSHSLTGRIFSAGLQKVSKIADMVTGKGFFKELSTFAVALMDFREGFLKNFQDIQNVFTSSKTKIIYVSTPERFQGKEQIDFFQFLKSHQLNLDKVFLNRVLPKFIDQNQLHHQLLDTLKVVSLNKEQTELTKLAMKQISIETETMQYLENALSSSVSIQLFEETAEDIHSLIQILNIAQQMSQSPNIKEEQP